MARDTRPSVLHLVDSLEGGGTEHTLVHLLNHLDSTQLRHGVITLRDAGVLAALLPDHVSCLALNTRGRTHRAGWRIAKEARRASAACIHARNTGAWFDAITAAAATPGLRPILGFHGFDTSTDFTRRQKWLARFGLCIGGRFASVSESGRVRMIEQCGIPGNLIDVSPNGVDTSRFTPPTAATRDEIRLELGIARDSIAIGAVGTLTPIKRIDLLLNAAVAVRRTMPGISLIIVGYGPQTDALEVLVSKLGLDGSVRLTGHRADVRRVLGAMDMFVNCSDAEGMSNALLEAMACSLPAIVTAVGDHGRLVRSGVEGLVIPPSSISELATAIATLAMDSGRRNSMARAARNRAESFTMQGTIERYDNWYHHLVFGRDCEKRISVRSDHSPLLYDAASSRTRVGIPRHGEPQRKTFSRSGNGCT